MPARSKSRQGERELDVLQALWRFSPATVAEVQERLRREGHEVAYTTVQTILNRLEEKGRVARDAADRAHRYRPLLKQPTAVTTAIRRVADRFFDGSVEELATHLVEKRLTPAQLDRIRSMLDRHRKDPGP